MQKWLWKVEKRTERGEMGEISELGASTVNFSIYFNHRQAKWGSESPKMWLMWTLPYFFPSPPLTIDGQGDKMTRVRGAKTTAGCLTRDFGIMAGNVRSGDDTGLSIVNSHSLSKHLTAIPVKASFFLPFPQLFIASDVQLVNGRRTS